MPAFVPAAAKTMALFEAFAQARREMSNSEIARALGVAESSSSDLLHTLHEIGYLMRTARSRRFYPTGRLMALATEIAGNDPLASAGQEAIELLSEKTGETALCGVLNGGSVEVLGIQESRYELRYILSVGTRISMHASALGKALLAALPPAEAAAALRARPLKAITPRTVVEPGVIERQLREIRRRGFARVEDEGTDGVSAMSVAGRVGGALLAVSLAGPTDRLRRNRRAYQDALLEVKALVFREDEAVPVQETA
ncbi:MAG: helix-turn-helix domain-containing protein [Burkholderiales bacterium]|nr:helix-turn-helix domain-containing protein [Burkholderiales bacterium]